LNGMFSSLFCTYIIDFTQNIDSCQAGKTVAQS
jgi:hypothetical protein